MSSAVQLRALHYETPTATLAVMMREAAISQWSDRPVVEPLRFELHITAPPDGDGATVTLRGDRDQLLSLQALVQNYIDSQLSGTGTMPRSPNNSPTLVPEGLTRHRFYGGALTPDASTGLILNSQQLADLGEIFDQLEQAVRVLPVGIAARRQRPWRQWSAAAGLVIAIGAATLIATLPTTTLNQTALESQPETSRRDSGAAPDASPESLPPPAEQDTARPAEEPNTVEEEANAGNATPDPAAREPSPASEETESAPPEAVPPPVAQRRPEVPPSAPAPASRPPTRPEDSPAPPVADDDSAAIAIAPEPFSSRADASPSAQAESGAIALRRSPTPPALIPLQAQLTEAWEPPPELDAPLDYALQITTDGTLAEVTATDALAERYRDRVPLPEIGSAIAPPNEFRTLGVQFFPDGQVSVSDRTPSPE
ncbi:MAG: DUF4335 domain-containing protein [Leptolyngbyaceae cyanobacterium T60_A2020_046]|nr:DUF4335 domain-containing protein [Leptolyngbyaceae cyanobacterium T60_A2020_046]